MGRIIDGVGPDRRDRGDSTTVIIASMSKNPELSSMRDGVNDCGVAGVSDAAHCPVPDLAE
jgi:hypothetical protein